MTAVHYNATPLTCFEADVIFPSDEDGAPIERPHPLTARVVSVIVGRIVAPWEITWSIPNPLGELSEQAPPHEDGTPTIVIATATIPGHTIKFRMYET
jgi:hypothetical protein